MTETMAKGSSRVRCGRFVGILLFLQSLPVFAADIPALLEIPAPLAQADPSLVERRQALETARGTLWRQVQAHNAQCDSVEEGSAQDIACTQAQADLSASLERHIAASKAFNQQKIKAEFARKLQGTRDADRYSPIDAPLPSDESDRSAYNYFNVIKQFDVVHAARYEAGADTFCNIYVSDVTRAMNAEIPIRPANDMVIWLHTTGRQQGWHRADARLIQEMADAGHPAIVIWENTSISPDTGLPGHGHVAMVRPGSINDPRGDAISAAGRYVIDARHMTGGDKTHPRGYFNKPGVQFWYHD
ncbi:MAG TPA: hypothetical protein VN809_02665 [Telmatospirillum sp.]|nr:hypothetical protein [Telmatospirillum sp.]